MTQAELEYFADHLSEISEDGVEMSDDDDDDDIFPQNFEDILPTYDDDENDIFDIDKMPMIILPDLPSESLPVFDKQFDESPTPLTPSEQLSKDNGKADNGEECLLLQENKCQNVLRENTTKYFFRQYTKT